MNERQVVVRHDALDNRKYDIKTICFCYLYIKIQLLTVHSVGAKKIKLKITKPPLP